VGAGDGPLAARVADTAEKEIKKISDGDGAQLLEIEEDNRQRGSFDLVAVLDIRTCQIGEERGFADPSFADDGDALWTVGAKPSQDAPHFRTAAKELIRILDHDPVQVGIHTRIIHINLSCGYYNAFHSVPFHEVPARAHEPCASDT
jgi:hypothetical protein